MFGAGLIHEVCAKTGCSHVSLHGRNSGAESARELFTHSASLWVCIVCNEKKIYVLGFRFFVSNIM